METTLGDRLLDCLRTHLGAAVAYAAPPAPLSGGFDTIIHALRLNGVVGDWSGPLVLRIMTRGTSGGRVRREAAAHAALDEAGFPVPRVLLVEPDPAPLGAPFLIMQRVPGETMRSAAAKSKSIAAYLAIPRRLAEIYARLHGVSGELLRDSARTFGVDLATMGWRPAWKISAGASTAPALADCRRVRDGWPGAGLLRPKPTCAATATSIRTTSWSRARSSRA
jgi:aminoglycoside phosphotransferase (APT) family kinase protein